VVDLKAYSNTRKPLLRYEQSIWWERRGEGAGVREGVRSQVEGESGMGEGGGAGGGARGPGPPTPPPLVSLLVFTYCASALFKPL
jgi:hypothetical protein